MQLQLLSTTACLTIYYDARYDGLFLDWTGELSLPAVQEACVRVAQCYLTRTYSRVLSSNVRVMGVGERVGTWLGDEFLPYLAAVGVDRIAWVSAPFLAGRYQAQTVINRTPTLVVDLFDTAEKAAAWLQQPRLAQVESALLPSWQLVNKVRLAQGVPPVRQQARLVQQEAQQRIGKRSLVTAQT